MVKLYSYLQENISSNYTARPSSGKVRRQEIRQGTKQKGQGGGHSSSCLVSKIEVRHRRSTNKIWVS